MRVHEAARRLALQNGARNDFVDGGRSGRVVYEIARVLLRSAATMTQPRSDVVLCDWKNTANGETYVFEEKATEEK